MTESKIKVFKAGDRIRIKEDIKTSDGKFIYLRGGETGEILSISQHSRYPINARLDNGTTATLHFSEIEKVEYKKWSQTEGKVNE